MERGRRSRSVEAVARLAPLALAVLVSACALATFNGEDYGVACGFTGSADKPCGMCIAANCQAAVNACCSDSACKKEEDTTLFGSVTTYGDPGALKLLDTCATGASCAGLEAHPQAQAMTACIQTSCQDSCDLWRKSSLRAPQTNCERSAGSEYSFPSCTCTVPATTEGAPTTPNSVTCNRKTVTDGQCCASEDWPAPASTCTCRVVICQPSGESCTCSRSSSYSKNAGVNACARGGCCIRSDGECACGSSYCTDSDVKVDQCTPSIVVCGRGSRTVESCSTK